MSIGSSHTWWTCTPILFHFFTGGCDSYLSRVVVCCNSKRRGYKEKNLWYAELTQVIVVGVCVLVQHAGSGEIFRNFHRNFPAVWEKNTAYTRRQPSRKTIRRSFAQIMHALWTPLLTVYTPSQTLAEACSALRCTWIWNPPCVGVNACEHRRAG